MELTQVFVDEDVRRLLAGTEREIAEAFTQIDTHLRNRFVTGARDRMPGLASEDLADAWQETLRDLLRAVREGRFHAVRELGPWLWTVFVRRATDRIRHHDRYRGLLDRAREALRKSSVREFFEELDDKERTDLLDGVRKAIKALPDRQRMVIQLYVEHYPESKDRSVLRRRVSEVTGAVESEASVKRALQEARRKIGELLKMRQL